MDTENMSIPAGVSNGHITEDEASLYDRQIRLWGLEAQNRMRSSTILILSLRSLAHETIKNLVLAGIGRLIIMDDGVVTEQDLGGGFLFREEDGAVGQERTAAALPQIASLNPLVQLTAFPTLSPFIRSPTDELTVADAEAAMVELLHREKVDIVVGCDLNREQIEAIDIAARKAGVMFYAAGTYGYYGYVFADLGKKYDYVINPPTTPNNPSPGFSKKTLSYPALSAVLDPTNWGLSNTDIQKGGSPYRGLSKRMTLDRAPAVVIGILALWEFEKRHAHLPTYQEGEEDEIKEIAEGLRISLGVNEAALPEIDYGIVDHLTTHATHFFPPTLAVLGGLLAQDVLRALAKKDKPIVNLLTVDSMGGVGVVTRWAMGDGVDV